MRSNIQITDMFKQFFASEKSTGIVLVICTFIAVLIANSAYGPHYLEFWQKKLGGLSIEHWINDGLMAIFFLLIGLELKRELMIGELSRIKHALLPVMAAIGGMVIPAFIHFIVNQGTYTQSGIGIPMATDIAFVIGALALLGNRIPSSLKVFVVAFAVIDDLGAIVIIATVYTAKLSIAYLMGALAIWLSLFAVNKVFKTLSLMPYLIGGILMWWLMQMSGIHATVAGVLLAFAIPFTAQGNAESASQQLESLLHKPVSFMILPLFALANTGILFQASWLNDLLSLNSMGIITGLVIGKPLGICLFSYLAVLAGFCRLPNDVHWSHIAGAGILGGIGFTMSIFITNLAFPGNAEVINASKLAILLASIIAGLLGLAWLRLLKTPNL